MKKNIIFITPYFAPAWSYGGPPRVIYTLAKELVHLGYDISVITTDALNEKRSVVEKELLNGIRIYRYKTISNYLSYRHKIFYVQNLLNKTKLIINSADYILFSDLRPLIHWQLYRYIKQNNIPYGVFSFGQIPYDFSIKAIMKKLFDILWVTDFVRNANTRFSQTEHETKMYQQYFDINPDNVQLLPLPVSNNRVSISSNIYSKYHLTMKDFIIIFVGRFNYLKGVDILLSALLPLIIKYNNIKLLLIGRDDGAESQLKNMIPDTHKTQIIFTGPLYNTQVFPLYQLASCFMLTPRYYEETSLASLEALSFGVPVIATVEADIPYLEKYKAGRIVPNDISKIQTAIHELYIHLNRKKGVLSKNATQLVHDHYSARTVALKLTKYIKEITK